MRFPYSPLGKTIGFIPKHVIVGLGLLAVTVTACLEKMTEAAPVPPSPPHLAAIVPTPPRASSDPRAVRLRRYFSRLHCPIKDLAEDFVRAADKNHLDWRLLPSISVAESGGGKAFKNNNIFGWNNGTQPFASIRSGIQEVASKLSCSPLYRNHDVAGKLRVYNPDENYVQNVLSIMNCISPDRGPSRHALLLENN